MNFSVTQDGKPLNPRLYTWDEETRTFSTKENCLVLDFKNWDNCTFNTGTYCTFNTGSDCTFNVGFYCTFDTGSNCTFNTDDNCTFKTWDNCTFKTDDNCTFKTGSDCTFKTGSDCTFKTGSDCTFNTDYNCTFKTSTNCTFDTGYNCTFDTGDKCILIRRDIFEFYDISNKKITTVPCEIKGYIEDGYYYLNNKKQYPAIIADGILSEIINKKGNVYKVKNHGEDEITYLIKDGNTYSHGETLEEARESLIYKISNRDTSAYKDYDLNTVLTFKEAIKMYRVITGACEAGTRYFIEQNQDKKKDKYTIKEIIELTEDQYGNDKLVDFFKEKNDD